MGCVVIPYNCGVTEVLRRVCGRFVADRLAMSLKIYIDESGFHEGSDAPAMAMGGFLSNEERWTKFEALWRKELDDEGGVTFHMSDLESRLGEFAGWTKDRKHSFICRLLPILNAHAGVGIGVGIRAEDYQALVPRGLAKTTKQYLEMPFVILWGRFLIELSEAAREIDLRGHKIACIFDQNQAMAGLMVETMLGVKRKYPEQSKWMGSISFEDKKDFLPLQAADFIAYETFKLVNNTFGQTQRPLRKTLEMLNPQSTKILYLDRDTLKDDIARLINYKP